MARDSAIGSAIVCSAPSSAMTSRRSLDLRLQDTLSHGDVAQQNAILENAVIGVAGSVQFDYGLGVERFERLRVSFPAAPLGREVSLCFRIVQQRVTVPVPKALPR